MVGLRGIRTSLFLWGRWPTVSRCPRGVRPYTMPQTLPLTRKGRRPIHSAASFRGLDGKLYSDPILSRRCSLTAILQAIGPTSLDRASGHHRLRISARIASGVIPSCNTPSRSSSCRTVMIMVGTVGVPSGFRLAGRRSTRPGFSWRIGRTCCTAADLPISEVQTRSAASKSAICFLIGSRGIRIRA